MGCHKEQKKFLLIVTFFLDQVTRRKEIQNLSSGQYLVLNGVTTNEYDAEYYTFRTSQIFGKLTHFVQNKTKIYSTYSLQRVLIGTLIHHSCHLVLPLTGTCDLACSELVA